MDRKIQEMQIEFSVLDGEDAFVRYSPVCSNCIHSKRDGLRQCKAFFGMIPTDIWVGRNDHTSPYPGDNGIQFESI